MKFRYSEERMCWETDVFKIMRLAEITVVWIETKEFPGPKLVLVYQINVIRSINKKK